MLEPLVTGCVCHGVVTNVGSVSRNNVIVYDVNVFIVHVEHTTVGAINWKHYVIRIVIKMK